MIICVMICRFRVFVTAETRIRTLVHTTLTNTNHEAGMAGLVDWHDSKYQLTGRIRGDSPSNNRNRWVRVDLNRWVRVETETCEGGFTFQNKGNKIIIWLNKITR